MYRRVLKVLPKLELGNEDKIIVCPYFHPPAAFFGGTSACAGTGDG
jgi:hypothetical protein